MSNIAQLVWSAPWYAWPGIILSCVLVAGWQKRRLDTSLVIVRDLTLGIPEASYRKFEEAARWLWEEARNQLVFSADANGSGRANPDDKQWLGRHIRRFVGHAVCVGIVAVLFYADYQFAKWTFDAMGFATESGTAQAVGGLILLSIAALSGMVLLDQSGIARIGIWDVSDERHRRLSRWVAVIAMGLLVGIVLAMGIWRGLALNLAEQLVGDSPTAWTGFGAIRGFVFATLPVLAIALGAFAFTSVIYTIHYLIIFLMASLGGILYLWNAFQYVIVEASKFVNGLLGGMVHVISDFGEVLLKLLRLSPVSYTHLTLPTILLV